MLKLLTENLKKDYIYHFFTSNSGLLWATLNIDGVLGLLFAEHALMHTRCQESIKLFPSDSLASGALQALFRLRAKRFLHHPLDDKTLILVYSVFPGCAVKFRSSVPSFGSRSEAGHTSSHLYSMPCTAD